MVFNTGAALLDAIVLAVVSHEAQGTYGYKITQDVRQAIDISESTLYPVLRRLQKDGCTGTSGQFIPSGFPICLRGVRRHDKNGIYEATSGFALRYF